MVVEKNAPHYSGKATPEAVAAKPGSPIALRVPAAMAGLRLDQALAQLLPDYSRSRLQDWVRRARVTVDGAAAASKSKVWGGERIEVRAELDPAARASTRSPSSSSRAPESRVRRARKRTPRPRGSG
jgi:23S rRNA pseudouridine1911/1915/1917 synthase